MSLKKVFWQDGTVITERHFFAFEKWVETLVGRTHLHHCFYGLIRNPVTEPEYNDIRLFSISRIEGVSFQIDIEKFQAIDSEGIFIKIDDKHTYQFRIPSNTEGRFYLYISCSDSSPRSPAQSETDVNTDVLLYEPRYVVTCSLEWERKVMLCSFTIDHGEVSIDQSYIPVGLFVDSSHVSKERFDKLIEKIQRWDQLIGEYSLKVHPENDTLAWWIGALQFRRSSVGFLAKVELPFLSTLHFLEELQKFLSEIQVTFSLLASRQTDELKRQRLTLASQSLQQRLYQPAEQYLNLTEILDRANNHLQTLVERIPDFHEGIGPIPTIPIAKVIFNRGEAGNNRFEVHFAHEVQFNRQKSKIMIKLRDFSRQDPGLWNIKVQLGKNGIWGQMPALRILLQRIPGESYSYKIECPANPEIIIKERESALTMYLPSPLGEGIQDLDKRITINVEE